MIEVLEYIGYAAPPVAAVYGGLMLTTHSVRPIKTMRADRKTAKAECVNGTGETITYDDVKVGASKELAIPADVTAPPIYELWDHPAPPIPLLATSLPSAPLGYGWEISTGPRGDDGNPHLKLCLLDLKSSLEVESIETDLLIVRRWKYAADETYAQYYRKAEAKSAKTVVGYHQSDWGTGGRPEFQTDHTKAYGKVMMANLITPMVDWARVLTLRYIAERPDETKTNYMLIQSPEEVDEEVG